jgi:molybdopterin-guanine dinucleotide biosynthesis protein B
MTPVDLLIIEGFKHHRHPKLEIFRREVGKALLCPDDPHIFAVASDGPVPEATVPVIDLRDAKAVADAIMTHLGLRGAPAATLVR